MTPYPLHTTRHSESCNDIWDFAFLGAIDPAVVDVARVRYDDRLPVPLAFDATPKYAGRRGTAVYRRWLDIPAGRLAKLRFGGAGMWCAVFVDGCRLTEHGNGYTEFHVEIPPAASNRRELVVVTDNQFCAERNPVQMEYYDWYHYGGLYRPVWLHVLPPAYLAAAQVTVRDLAAGRIRVRVTLGGAAVSAVKLTAAIDGTIVQDATVSVTDGAFTLDLTVPDPHPWSPADPHLHTLRLATADDDLIVRFGLRTLQVDGARLLLNGAPLKLKGFCRHEAHPQFGPALPPALMIQDLQQLKDMGCNFIRGSHYPQDQRFLDLCDELGLLVWEEATAWGNKEAHFRDAHFCEAQLRGVAEMIAASFNHPSVILWGFLNEGDTRTTSGRDLYRRMADLCHRLDPSRPVTFGDMHAASICLPLADVISFNLYPAWYGSETIEQVPQALRDRVAVARQTTGDVRPFIVSEIGAAAMYGCRDNHGTRWSEQYQARLLETVCGEVLTNPDILGVSFWQFCDMRTSEEVARVLQRPRAFNNKGVMDEYRRPKQAYFSVRDAFTAPPRRES
jgi:beta-glucuronidase